uniref:NADH-ubiquinone oxidoreductase chain 3 n=1 Tax=Malassezia obtusa TaxID=76774 RepID=A0A2I6QCN5_9BASI|nr:NADH dehydrogenase subunit 3 [Malassezia obtusa]
MNAITIYLILVPVIGFILLLANILLAKHVPYAEKVTSYECGFSPIYGQNRSPFTIQFYLVGILFLIFDVEIFMTMPYALTVTETGNYGFWIIMVFFAILTLGFVFEYSSKALYFSGIKANPTKDEDE